MTLKHDICKMFRRKEVIPCCSVSYIKYINKESSTIDIRVNDVWVKIKPCIPDYRNYSHSMSPEALYNHHPKVYQKMYGDIHYSKLYVE